MLRFVCGKRLSAATVRYRAKDDITCVFIG